MNILVTADGPLAWRRPDGTTRRVRCAIGRGGVGVKSREGDGITPLGKFPLRRVFFRPDRLQPPATGLRVVALQENQGWCDDPGDSAYNTLVVLPCPGRHERMWRDDDRYDIVIETGFNDDPVMAGRGSAIFVHIAPPDYRPTEGCVALARPDLLDLLADCDAASSIEIRL